MSTRRSEMLSTTPASGPVTRAAVVTHGRIERIGDAADRLRAVAARCGVELVEDTSADLAVVLGGDGTTLRALHRYLGTEVPCLGVNFGRVGFLTSVDAGQLEAGIEQAFSGGYEVIDLPTLRGHDGLHDLVAINDIVLTSGILGRMVILEWSVDGTSLGEVGCDGAILATPTGSTAYNLSAGGPVLAWGADAFVLSFASPHSLHARSMVLGEQHRVEVHNRSDDVPLQVVQDGHSMGDVPPGGRMIGGHGGAARAAGAAGRHLILQPLPGDVHGVTLLRLQIDNLALIDHAELELGPGLNVFTGETGAGKTMLAQAIGLLAGAAPAAGMVGPHGAETYVEAEFAVPDGFFERLAPEAVAALRPRARRRWWWRGGSPPAAAAGRWCGGEAAHATISSSWASCCSRCPRSTRRGAWPGRPRSSTCSMRPPATTGCARHGRRLARAAHGPRAAGGGQRMPPPMPSDGAASSSSWWDVSVRPPSDTASRSPWPGSGSSAPAALNEPGGGIAGAAALVNPEGGRRRAQPGRRARPSCSATPSATSRSWGRWRPSCATPRCACRRRR